MLNDTEAGILLHQADGMADAVPVDELPEIAARVIIDVFRDIDLVGEDRLGELLQVERIIQVRHGLFHVLYRTLIDLISPLPGSLRRRGRLLRIRHGPIRPVPGCRRFPARVESVLDQQRCRQGGDAGTGDAGPERQSRDDAAQEKDTDRHGTQSGKHRPGNDLFHNATLFMSEKYKK